MSLRVRWDTGARYRSFVSRPAGMADIVSSRIRDDATGQTIGPVVFVTDPEGFFCDLELRLDETASLDAARAKADAPVDAVRLQSPFDTRLDLSASVSSAVGSDWLIIRFFDGDRGSWHQLDDQPLYLLADQGNLLAIAALHPTDDVDGRHEAHWLDEIEGRRLDEGAGSPVEA